MGKFFTYVLRNKELGRNYVGFTSDLRRRLKEHNSGKTKSTKNRGIWEIIYFEEFESRLDARNREKYFKSGVGREYINNLHL